MESLVDGSSLSPKTHKSSGIVLMSNPISTPKAAQPPRPVSPREVKNDVPSPVISLHSAMKPVYNKYASPPNEKQSHRSPSEGEIARKWANVEKEKIKSVEEMIADTLSAGASEQVSRQLSHQATSVSQPYFCPSPTNSMYSASVYAEAKQSFTNTEVSEYVSSINKSGEIGEVCDFCDFMESRRPSTYRGSTGSDLSDESRSSSFSSTIYKPHKANDTRWEAIQAVRSRYRMLGLDHFRLLRKLGCGDIGSVYLSELKGTGSYFATKIMDKEALAGRKKLLRAQTEREILQSLDHPFLPTLYAHFETEKFSCLVMELCPGGDLHALRQRQPGKYFPEHAARFYAAEVLLALEYLHMLGIIYRDLKPENVLVREDGHIMLSDFDLSFRCAVSPTLISSSNPEPYLKNSTFCVQPACIEPTCIIQPKCFAPRMLSSKSKREKELRRMKSDTFHQVRLLPELIAEPTNARSMSFVGTHEYLAPEIIKGEGHGSAVDWWTFGIFLYELLFGKTPFVGVGNRATLINVVRQSLRFPETPVVSFAARDLIRGLLVKEPQHRLAYRRGATEVKQHPFFQGVNWALIRCTNPPDMPWPVIIDTPVKPSNSPSPPLEMTPPSASEVEMKPSVVYIKVWLYPSRSLLVRCLSLLVIEGTVATLLVSYTCNRTYPLHRPMALHFALLWVRFDPAVVASKSHYDQSTIGDITVHVHGSCIFLISSESCLGCLNAIETAVYSLCRFPLRVSIKLADSGMEFQEVPLKQEF